jgi:hypothetical protein
MDVSASTSVTACVGQNSCTLSAPPTGGFLPTNNSTYSGPTTQLPLSLGGSYYTNPCAGISTSLSVQATCGMCR